MLIWIKQLIQKLFKLGSYSTKGDYLVPLKKEDSSWCLDYHSQLIMKLNQENLLFSYIGAYSRPSTIELIGCYADTECYKLLYKKNNSVFDLDTNQEHEVAETSFDALISENLYIEILSLLKEALNKGKELDVVDGHNKGAPIADGNIHIFCTHKNSKLGIGGYTTEGLYREDFKITQLIKLFEGLSSKIDKEGFEEKELLNEIGLLKRRFILE